jgi:hypothetical protein
VRVRLDERDGLDLSYTRVSNNIADSRVNKKGYEFYSIIIIAPNKWWADAYPHIENAIQKITLL